MKKLLTIFILSAFTFIPLTTKGQSESYDPDLAQKLQADDYGMRKYVIAFLFSGDRISEYTPEEKAEIQKGHMANITKLAEMEKLILAGPFFGNDTMRGIFIFNVNSKEEAEELTNTDPAVQAGVLKMDLKEWYGSAALLMIPEFHKKIQKSDF
ncbi:YciI family protein [Aquiflexum lacus]|uniref:YciI family protein n=1 Tax=Aquiflexum lacus TaxID=2483805 RepID=UPI001894D41A|nr:YciI family protein [Aquiflexum lacus]